jgi:uncharacterized damage-inducible protein DinB
MPPHNLATITPPRTLAHVLLDLKEARADWIDALDDVQNGITAADDRATEAETRLEDLRAEFGLRCQAATGLTVDQIRTAYAEALL